MPNEEVEPTVPIEVEKRRRHAPPAVVDSSGRYIGKGAITPVSIKMVAAKGSDVQIDAAIIVVIANCGTHAVLSRFDGGGLRHVRERHDACAVRPDLEIVAEQLPAFRAGATDGLCAPIQAATLHEEDVEVSIVVVVQQCGTGSNDLRVVELPCHPVDVNEIEMRV